MNNFRIFIFIFAMFVPFLSTASDIQKGNKLYQRYCVNCHGINGRSVMPTAPDFTNRHSLLKSDRSLVSHIESGKNSCPSFKRIINENDIYDLVAYLRTFR